MNKVYCILLIFICLVTTSEAQNSKIGTWNYVAAVLSGDSVQRWGAGADVQIRTNGVFSQLQYEQLKTGVSYYINQNFTALVGAGDFNSYDYKGQVAGSAINEFRLYEQLTSSRFLSWLKIEQRFRVEQRWESGNYQNRFRYRLDLFIPINNTRIEQKTYFVSVNDEVFLNNKAPDFEGNRVYSGAGYQFNRLWILQLGWMNKYSEQLKTSSNKNYGVMMLIYRIQRKKQMNRELMPTSAN